MSRHEIEPGVFREIADPFADLPRGHFKVILADPPWPFATWSHKGQGRSGEAHYNTMMHADLEAMPVRELAASDSVLFLWVVQTQIPQAVRLVDAWGFELKSVAFASNLARSIVAVEPEYMQMARQAAPDAPLRPAALAYPQIVWLPLHGRIS